LIHRTEPDTFQNLCASPEDLVERLRARRNDPLVPLLHHAGLVATFRLLTSGTLPAGALTPSGNR
jgi:hypothetical protein